MRSLTYTPQESMDRSARWLVVAMLGLLGLGVVMVASASVFVVGLRRRTMGPGVAGLGLESWADRLRSKWRR